MARFAFVTRNGLDLISGASIPCSCAGVAPYMAPESFGYRVVFGFFVGQFILDEIDRFMTDVAASSGSAPVAGDYFKSFEHESRVSTGGIYPSRKACSSQAEYRILSMSTTTSNSLTR